MNHDAINRINTLILKERKRQDELWGWPNAGLAGPNNELKMTILAEEVGEVAHAILEGDVPNLHEELIQVAAVCAAWLESEIDRGRL